MGIELRALASAMGPALCWEISFLICKVEIRIWRCVKMRQHNVSPALQH